MTTFVLDTKFGEVQNKIPVVTSIVTNSVLNTKCEEIEDKIPVVSDLAKKSDFSNVLKSSYLNTKLTTLRTKAELKAWQDKTVNLKTCDLSYFFCKIFLSDNGLKLCLFISQHLVCYSNKKTGTLIMLLLENQKVYVVLLFLP